jgi:hypothetical protein
VPPPESLSLADAYDLMPALFTCEALSFKSETAIVHNQQQVDFLLSLYSPVNGAIHCLVMSVKLCSGLRYTPLR